MSETALYDGVVGQIPPENFYLGDAATLASLTTGNKNIAIGSGALENATETDANICIGSNAGKSLVDSSGGNIFFGHQSGASSTGVNNCFLGHFSGYYHTDEEDIFIVDNEDRGNKATEISTALLYGYFENHGSGPTLNINGTLAVRNVGVGVPATSEDSIKIENTRTTAYRGIYVKDLIRPAAGIARYHGLEFAPVVGESDQNITSLVGAVGTVGWNFNSLYEGTVSLLAGISATVSVKGNRPGTGLPDPTITTMRILEGKVSIGAGIDGLNVGTLQGLYLGPMIRATTNWAIYSDGGDSFFDGDIAFGQTDKAERIGSDADGTLDLYAETSIVLHDGVLRFEGTGRIGWTKITADSITKGNGTHSGTFGDTLGNVEDLQAAFDGELYHIVEVNATPGLEVEIHFTGVTAFNWVQVLAVYAANAVTHSVSAMLWNWDTSAWDAFNEMDMHGNELPENYSFFVPDDTNYIGTGGDAGKVNFKFSHTMNGTPGHDFVIDVVALYGATP